MFGLSQSYPIVTTPAFRGPLLDEGPSSGAGEPPLWQQILGGLRDFGSILDPWILTEQERAQLELQKALGEAQKAKAQAEMTAIAKEKAGPNWLLIAGAVALGGLVVYLLLKE